MPFSRQLHTVIKVSELINISNTINIQGYFTLYMCLHEVALDEMSIIAETQS